MRAFNHHIGSPSMALVTESVDVGTAFKQAMSRLRRKARQRRLHRRQRRPRALPCAHRYQALSAVPAVWLRDARMDDRSPRPPVASREQLAVDRGVSPVALRPAPWADRHAHPADRSRGSRAAHPRGSDGASCPCRCRRTPVQWRASVRLGAPGAGAATSRPLDPPARRSPTQLRRRSAVCTIEDRIAVARGDRARHSNSDQQHADRHQHFHYCLLSRNLQRSCA